MLGDQQIFAANLIKEGKKLPEEMMATAEIKMTGFNILKGEIDASMAKVHDALDDVRTKIRENARSKHNQDGLLTSKQEEYLQCLEIDYRKLENLLNQDEEKWAKNIEVKKSKAKEFDEKLKALVAK